MEQADNAKQRENSDIFNSQTAHQIVYQGGEFAHRISERISRFLPKNEGMSDSLKKMSDSLIRSFFFFRPRK